MKIFAVINNYPAAEGGGSPFGPDTTPDWYEMPDSSVVRSGNPMFVPDFAADFRAFPSVVYRIGRLGKSISPRFAARYIDAASMAVAVVAADLLADLRASGKPWTRAVAFDRSCLLGNLQPIDTFNDSGPFEIHCGDSSTTYRADALRSGIDSLISMLSADNTLKNGDLVLAALTPQGLPMKPDTRLRVINSSETNLLDINIK